MNQIIELGECCPKCHEPQEVQTTCSYGGKEYKVCEEKTFCPHSPQVLIVKRITYLIDWR